MATANNIRKLCPNVVSTRAIYRAGSEIRFSKTCPPAKSLRRGGHSVALSSPWLSRHVLLSTLLECSLRRQFSGYQLPRGWGHHGSCLWHFTSAPSQSQMLNVLDGASFAKTARKKLVTLTGAPDPTVKNNIPAPFADRFLLHPRARWLSSTLIQGLKKLRIQDGLSHKAIPSIKPHPGSLSYL